MEDMGQRRLIEKLIKTEQLAAVAAETCCLINQPSSDNFLDRSFRLALFKQKQHKSRFDLKLFTSLFCSFFPINSSVPRGA